ncbi:T9SS type A sorting domain-containing protein [Mesonia ostreae]|uniref:T9SS type A sorting domain-containing protein n=1 Tax=Mesonia ostreae TaxID=861110 RepID=A0ABU2KG93_9FLAO|nr:T9SS type A sorting domain-containing protein [Mesonia ostreae]MDT0293728.1 T9SS type A sorting domain-containing protein [Mesonia ostreae]
MQAQDFPNPYCDLDDTSVEEITSVAFAGSNMTNTDLTSILVDETAVVSEVTIGETYTLAVKGNTYGDFQNKIVAFIDWNQNEILDDANEIYEVGSLINSTGDDDISVSMDITVPADALEGPTRIRITKTYEDADSVAIINPCAIEFDPFGMGANPGFGQALDFTLNVGVLNVNHFDAKALIVYPVPTQDILHIEYKSEINSVKVYNLLGQEVLRSNMSASRVKLSLSTLSAGSYVVKISTEEGQHNFRVVK